MSVVVSGDIPEFPSSPVSGYVLNKQTGHGRGGNLGTRLITVDATPSHTTRDAFMN